MTNWRNNEACSAALAKAWDGGQGVCVFTSTEIRDLLDAAVAASGSPPSPPKPVAWAVTHNDDGRILYCCPPNKKPTIIHETHSLVPLYLGIPQERNHE